MRGLHHALRIAAQITNGDMPDVPKLAGRVVAALARQIGELQLQLTALENELLAWHRSSELSQRLATIPGVGVVSGAALAASVSEPQRFASAHQRISAPVRRVVGADPAATIKRRQGATRAHLKDGRPIRTPASGVQYA